MSEPLPPLSALRAFEATARHLSFTRAAEELGMTQAAVSYQIKLLEERIGSPLFLRQPRKIALSDTGQRLAPGIIQAFDAMRDAVASTRSQAGSTLSISTMQTFASNWLAYHIGSFQLAHPGIAVRLDASEALVDFSRDQFDVGIRSGRGEWPGLRSHLLIEANFSPMMTPDLAARVKEPEDLLHLNLLDSDDPWWPIWFKAEGIDVDMKGRGPEMLMDSQVLAGGRALAGDGAAILTPAFFSRELQSGRLVQPFERVSSRGIGYWLVYPEARRNAPNIRAFRDWILQEITDHAAATARTASAC